MIIDISIQFSILSCSIVEHVGNTLNSIQLILALLRSNGSLFRANGSLLKVMLEVDLPKSAYSLRFFLENHGDNTSHEAILAWVELLERDPETLIETVMISGSNGNFCRLEVCRKEFSNLIDPFPSSDDISTESSHSFLYHSKDGEQRFLYGDQARLCILIKEFAGRVITKDAILKKLETDKVKLQALIQRTRVNFTQNGVPCPFDNVHGIGYTWKTEKVT